MRELDLQKNIKLAWKLAHGLKNFPANCDEAASFTDQVKMLPANCVEGCKLQRSGIKEMQFHKNSNCHVHF